jgi:hypothetical protein
MTKKPIAYTLIASGVFLEVLYYVLRFTSDGTHWTVSVIQGIALTALLLGLVSIRKWFLWFIIIPLGMYSIANTSAGQRQALITKAQEERKEINETSVNALERVSSIMLDQYETNANAVKNTVTDLESAWEYKNTLNEAQSDQGALVDDILALNETITGLKEAPLESTSNMQLYQFWCDVFGWERPDRLQLFMQVLFSFFIAIMAPTGMIMLREDNPSENWDFLVKKWVNVNWIGIRTGKSSTLLDREHFNNFIETRNIVFPSGTYDRILAAAHKKKVVDNNQITCNSESEAIELILKEVSNGRKS